jgi:hypothetical protein
MVGAATHACSVNAKVVGTFLLCLDAGVPLAMREASVGVSGGRAWVRYSAVMRQRKRAQACPRACTCMVELALARPCSWTCSRRALPPTSRCVSQPEGFLCFPCRARAIFCSSRHAGRNAPFLIASLLLKVGHERAPFKAGCCCCADEMQIQSNCCSFRCTMEEILHV